MTETKSPPHSPFQTRLHRALNRVIEVHHEEVAPLLLGILCYALLLAGYYILRPLRETVGIHRGSEQLPYLMASVMLVSMVLNPLYSSLVARLPRSRFIPLVYRSLIGLLLMFYGALQLLEGQSATWAGWVFYVFLSVFNLFIVSIFWSLMADLFNRERAVRLFATVAVGGSIGALVGSSLTQWLVTPLGPANLVLISVVLLELGTRAALAIHKRFGAEGSGAHPQALQARDDLALGGSRWAGIREIIRSPYLLGIACYMVLYGLSSTFAYMIQGQVVEAAASTTAERTVIFATMDFWTNVITLVLQGGITARLLKWIGAGPAMALLPAYSALGFLVLSSGWIEGGAAMLTAFMIFQVFRRALGYGVAKPIREMLYTVLPAEQKYKSKNLLDIFMPRAGDALGAFSSSLLKGAGMGLGALALAALPVSALGIAVGLGLGIAFQRKEGSVQ